MCALCSATLYEGFKGRLSLAASDEEEEEELEGDKGLEEEGNEKVQLATRVRTEGGQGQDATGKAAVVAVVVAAAAAAASAVAAIFDAGVDDAVSDDAKSTEDVDDEDEGAGATAEAGEALRSSMDPSASATVAAAAPAEEVARACLRRTD